jgi:DNA-binding NarL/FixJ family response regulator
LLAREPRSPRVLVLTTFDLDEYVYEALRGGASGFLLKDAGADELLHAVRVVAAGESLLSPSITRRLIADYARRPPLREQPSALAELTPRELEVLRLIARGLSNGDIARELVVGDATVKTHVSRIFTKLDLHDRAQAVVLAMKAGSKIKSAAASHKAILASTVASGVNEAGFVRVDDGVVRSRGRAFEHVSSGVRTVALLI